MATRFYYVAGGVPAISPVFDGSWNSVAGVVRRSLAIAKAATTEQSQVDIGDVGPSYTCHVQLISPPLAPQTISGTVSVVSRGRELASIANVNKRARSVRVFSSDGLTLRGTLNAWNATTSTTELSPTTLQGQQHANGAALTPVVCQDGDVIVVEVGYGVGTGGTTPQALMAWGGDGADHANANSDITGSVPWIEFSADLVLQEAGEVTEGALVGVDASSTADAFDLSGAAGGADSYTAAASAMG